VRGDWAERIEATIRGNRYVFTFREITTSMPDGEPFTYGQLHVDFQGRKVMAIDCTCEQGESVARMWTPGDVSAFIEGLWIDELNFVFADVTRLHEERNRRALEEARKQELSNLKKKLRPLIPIFSQRGRDSRNRPEGFGVACNADCRALRSRDVAAPRKTPVSVISADNSYVAPVCDIRAWGKSGYAFALT
jgi:hypothetical protein